jgi:hypothetical protein
MLVGEASISPIRSILEHWRLNIDAVVFDALTSPCFGVELSRRDDIRCKGVGFNFGQALHLLHSVFYYIYPLSYQNTHKIVLQSTTSSSAGFSNHLGDQYLPSYSQ